MAIIGAIIGDIIGSKFEFNRAWHPYGCELFTDENTFTDDTVMTIAIKHSCENGIDYAENMRRFAKRYPGRGYGGMFSKWLYDPTMGPYNSFGNGAAMRISYLAEKYDDFGTMVDEVTKATMVTHDHEEGITGALITASCIWKAKNGASKDEIMEAAEVYTGSEYPYPITMTLAQMSQDYQWNETCQGSVPVALRCFYESDNYETFVRNVLSLPCDTDTIAAIGGGIAEEFYGGTGFDNKAILSRYLDKALYTMIEDDIK